MEQKSTLNFQKADFSLKARTHSSATSKNDIPDSAQKKSSYICPVSLQNNLKILAVKRGVNLNSLLIEAMEDILDKYKNL